MSESAPSRHSRSADAREFECVDCRKLARVAARAFADRTSDLATKSAARNPSLGANPVCHEESSRGSRYCRRSVVRFAYDLRVRSRKRPNPPHPSARRAGSETPDRRRSAACNTRRRARRGRSRPRKSSCRRRQGRGRSSDGLLAMVVDEPAKPSAELTNVMRAKSSDRLSAADLDGNAIPSVHHGKPRLRR